MKNQYFGDLNDYRKYALLRGFVRAGGQVTVCWMLTTDDGRSDGNRVKYLNLPRRWKKYDAALFEFLAAQRHCANRNLAVIESSGLLGDCVFHSAVVPPEEEHRAAYFRDLTSRSRSSNLVFLDPDNGFEVASLKDSTKYLYWNEVRDLYSSGKSVLVYQHLPRVKRTTYIPQLLDQAKKVTRAREAYAYLGGFSVFVLLPQGRLLPVVEQVNSEIQATWGSKFTVW